MGNVVESVGGLQPGLLLMKKCERCGDALRAGTRFCSRSCAKRTHWEMNPGASRRYRRIYLPDHPLAMSDGLVLEHRIVLHDAVVEIPLGCHVHHRNGDGLDNRLENLEVLPASAHAHYHGTSHETVQNQYGEFPLRPSDPEARREHMRRLLQESRARRRTAA